MKELPVVTATYEVYKQLIELQTETSGSHPSYASESMIDTCHQILVELITVKHTPEAKREQPLIRAHVQAEVLSLQLEVMEQTQPANKASYVKIEPQLTEIRHTLDEWLKTYFQ